MGVMGCFRFNCDEIMCRLYNSRYGYICRDCFNEMELAQKEDTDFTVEKFMRSDKRCPNEHGQDVDLKELFDEL